MEPTESKVKETMESIDGMSRANANPFLYDKIMHRMQAAKQTRILRPAAIGLAMAFIVLLIGLNLITLVHYNKTSATQVDGTSLVKSEYFSYLNNF